MLKYIFFSLAFFITCSNSYIVLNRLEDGDDVDNVNQDTLISSINTGPILEKESAIVLNYGSSHNSNPVILKRVKRKRGGFGGRGRSRISIFKKKKPKHNVPSNSYPKQPGFNSGYNRPPSPGWNVNKPPPPGWNVPVGQRSPAPKFNGGFPKLGGGYGSYLGGSNAFRRGAISSRLSRGGTGRALGAGLLGAGIGLYGGYQLGRLMSFPYYRRPDFNFKPNHDHYHDEHGHYLAPDGLFYVHLSNQMAHDSRDFLKPGQIIEGYDPSVIANDGRLVRFYPYNETYGIFEYTNKSTVAKRFEDEQRNRGSLHWAGHPNSALLPYHSIPLIITMLTILLF